jgi:putative ABC transport system permease protein
VLAEKAAADLGVTTGDLITLHHPQATPTGLRTAQTPIRVAGIHPNPMRMLAYLILAIATAAGLTLPRLRRMDIPATLRVVE